MILKGLLFFLVFYVVDEVHFPKWLATGIPGVAPANVFFVMTLFAIRSTLQPETLKTRPLLQTGLMWFYGALTFAFVWGELRAPGEFMRDLTYWKNALFYPLFYFLYLRSRQDEKTTRLLIIWIMVIAAVAGLEGLREGIDYGFGHYDAFRRASGPFGTDWHEANRAGVFYAMFISMFIALALFLKRAKLWRLAAIGGCLVIAGGALSTYSRQSYFMILLALALLLLRKSVIVAVIIGIALVSAATYLPESVTQRVEETKQQGKHGEEELDVSTASRFELWAGGMEMLAHNPIGVGLDHWPDEIGNYTRYKHIDAHNFYVKTLVECGPFGLFTLLFLIYSLFKLAAYLRKNRDPDDSEMHALTIGFTVMVLNMALGGLYGSPTLEGNVMSPFWAMCGLLERYVQLRQQSKADGGGSSDEERPPPREAELVERFPLAKHIPQRR